MLFRIPPKPVPRDLFPDASVRYGTIDCYYCKFTTGTSNYTRGGGSRPPGGSHVNKRTTAGVRRSVRDKTIFRWTVVKSIDRETDGGMDGKKIIDKLSLNALYNHCLSRFAIAAFGKSPPRVCFAAPSLAKKRKIIIKDVDTVTKPVRRSNSDPPRISFRGFFFFF